MISIPRIHNRRRVHIPHAIPLRNELDNTFKGAISFDDHTFKTKDGIRNESQGSHEPPSQIPFTSPRVVRTRSRMRSSPSQFFCSTDRFQIKKLNQAQSRSSNTIFKALQTLSSSDMPTVRQSSALSGNVFSNQESTASNKVPTVTLLRKQLMGLLPIEEHDAALSIIFTKFPDIMCGSPPFSEVLAVVTGGALYTYFARTVAAKAACQSASVIVK